MILEALVTTVDRNGQVHLAPLGTTTNRQQDFFELRPFQGTRSLANLRATPRAVIHVTDDALLLARAVTGNVEPAGLTERDPQWRDCFPLRDACRWWAVEVQQWIDHAQRPTARCTILGSRRLRDGFGWNRGQYAVLEAAILYSRVHLIAPEVWKPHLAELKTLVERTGGDGEQEAFSLIESSLARAVDSCDEV